MSGLSESVAFQEEMVALYDGEVSTDVSKINDLQDRLAQLQVRVKQMHPFGSSKSVVQAHQLRC